MYWDPEVESPATVAIIGAGATGIEAALYARFLGYQVLLFEAGKVAQRYRKFASLLMEEAMDQAVSPLGVRALEAQSGKPIAIAHRPVTYKEFAEQYLLPLARTDLVHDCVQFQCEVIDISRIRVDAHPCDTWDYQARCNDEFRIVLRSKARGVWSTRADVVLDCSGLVTAAPRLGPCFGLTQFTEFPLEEIITSFERWQYCLDTEVSETIAIWGAGEWSRKAVQGFLERLSAEPRGPRGKLIWLIPEWSVTQRDLQAMMQLETQLIDLQTSGYSLRVLGIENVMGGTDGANKGYANLLLPDETFLKVSFDRLVALDRVRANFDFARALMFQPEQGFRSEQSVASVPPFTGKEVDHCSPWKDLSGWRLATAEPGYYILGTKRQHSTSITYVDRRADIRDVFAMLGGRSDLDLYS